MGDGLFSIYFYGASSFSGSMWFIPFFFFRCFFWSSGVGYTATRIFDSDIVTPIGVMIPQAV
jgi:hypothetical protein